MTERTQGSPLVGRERELADLIGLMESAASGRGRMALLVGEPGIGKSRLAAELGEVARRAGHPVLSGRCWADAGTLAYWPWIQVLRGFLRIADRERLDRLRPPPLTEVARIVPDLSETSELASVHDETDPDLARFRLFDAVATLLGHGPGPAPLVILIEDLHAADLPSISLLRFVVSQLSDMPILVVGTYRELELGPTHPTATAVEQLARDPNAVPIRLAGLAIADASRLLRATVGAPAPGALADALWRETRGNPLFLAQAAQLLRSEGRFSLSSGPIELAVPVEVRDVILRRTTHVGPDAVGLLSRAAVIGPEFDIATLRQLTDLTADDLERVVTGAVTAGLVVDAGAPGDYRFAHDLIRESLHATLTPTERMLIHRQMVEALESRRGSDPARHVATLAYHALEAARGRSLDDPATDAAPLAERAIEYARQAGEQALRAAAFEEAARLYRTAIAVGISAESLDDRRHVRLLLLLGEAESRANNLEMSREAFLEAADIGRRLGSARDVARAALGYGGRLVWSRAGNDTRLIPLLREALVLLGGADDMLRARLLTRLACATRSDPEQRAMAAAMSAQAVELARQLQDDATLTYALGGRAWAIWWPDNIDERMEIARELLTLARNADDPERMVDAHTMLALSYVDLGKLDRGRAELAEVSRLAGRIRQQAQRWLGTGPRVSVELAVGNYAAAEELMESEMAEGRPTTPARDDVSAARMHRFLLSRERGTLANEEHLVRSAASEFPWYPLHRAALANLLLDLGRRPEAAAVVQELAAGSFAALYEDNEWLLGMSLTSEAVARLGDREAAAVLYERLLPRAGRHAVGHPEGSVGSTDRYLGLLAAALGDRDAAVRHLDDAVRHNARMGLRPWTAHAQADLVRILAERDADGDRPLAQQLASEALATARDIGMSVLERELRSGDAASGTAESPLSASIFRREGEVWTVAFSGLTSRMRDSRGLGHIARLLAQPGRELHAVDLAGDPSARGSGAPMADGASVVSLDMGKGSGPRLDATAKAEYRQRVADLRADLSEAESWNDDERATRLRAELDLLLAELGAAVGLGGRDRSSAANAERARLSVTRAIRSAIGRIGDHNDALRQHFAATIHTGTYCSYRPDPRVGIAWDL